jgi:hypothetical protein
MTPQEQKAKEIIQDIDKYFEGHYVTESTIKELAVDKYNAIIKELEYLEDYVMNKPIIENRIHHYQQVIKEIEKL